MSRVEQIEHQVKLLTSEELAAFRAWFTGFDGEAWDRQIEADAQAGALDALAKQAIEDHEAGLSTEL